MQFIFPAGKTFTFDVPTPWLEAAGALDFVAATEHYAVAGEVDFILPFEEFLPPLRDGGKIWFRGRETVVGLLAAMVQGRPLPPVHIWPKERRQTPKFEIKDGLHRFYLSAALGFTKLPVRIEEFDMARWSQHEAF